jgi:hypothetical protein
MNVVAATKHVVYGDLVAVTWCFGLAVAGCVAVVEAKTVALAVVESVERALRRRRSTRLVGLRGRIASVAGTEVTVSFLVSSVEVGFELGDGVLFFRDLAPVFDGIGKHACFLVVLSGCSDCGGCGDCTNAMGESEACAELLPEIFDGLFGGPWAMEVVEIFAEVVG